MRTGDWRRKRSWQSETIKSPAQTDKKNLKKKICVAKCLWIKEPVCLLACKALSRTLCILFLSTVSTFKKKRLAIFYHLFPCFWCVCLCKSSFYNHNQLSLHLFLKDSSDFSGSYLFHQKNSEEEEKKKTQQVSSGHFFVVWHLSFPCHFYFPSKK